jgi:ubiquinone/menaquinone biosynthesis C-methylase UbiE/catechol 2,3-dioxygenase-like lactoylglutathione lyase family enzyme
VSVVEPEYTIRGGRSDARRLERQARVMAAASARFLSDAGLREGWACLDVGCGDGAMTVAMARAAGAGGRAVGVDIDADALEVAREAAARAEVAARFVCRSAAEVIERNAFDLAYSRLLLSHLSDPSSVVRTMVASVRPGGVVAVEDLFTGTLHSEPAVGALDRLQEAYSATVRDHGGDPTIGPRLGALLTAAGLENIHESTVSNPMGTVEEKLFIAELVDGMRAAMVACGAITDAEATELRADLEHAARDPRTVFYQARIHQVRGRRPELAADATATVAIDGLDHVQIAAPAGCEAQAQWFFGQLLGMPEVAKPEPLAGRGGVWFGLGTEQLHVGVEQPFAPARKAHPALRVAPGELDVLAARLTAAGVAVRWDDALPCVRRFYADDPWGNRIELVEGPER